MRVLVTGANGFVGTHVCTRLANAGIDSVAAVRTATSPVAPGAARVTVGEIAGNTRWDEALDKVTCVVHLAARVHVMRPSATVDDDEYRRINVEGTVGLARRAAEAGVKRFVFVSTVKVHGEGRDIAYSEGDAIAPYDNYARSKADAERALREIERDTGMAVAILRPPLIYGPGVGANFLRLMEAIHRGLPLPLGRVHNRRSLLFAGNLADAIARCLEHPAAAGRTYLVSDGEDISVAALIRQLAAAMDLRARILPVPRHLLRIAGRVTGKQDVIERLIESLTVDSRAIREELAWVPPISLAQGLAATAAHYWKTHGR